MVAQTTTIESVTVIRPLKITALLCLIISLGLMIAALSTNNWLRTGSYHTGLFNECTDTGGLDSLIKPISGSPLPGQCQKTKDYAYVKAVISLLIISCIIILFASISNILGLKSDDQHRKYLYHKVATGLTFLAVLCDILSLIIYPACFYNIMSMLQIRHWELDYSYAIAWGAFSFAFTALLLKICDKEHEEVYYKEKTVYNPPQLS
ncbi:PMP-22/EMP/MP20/Claudin superfamily-containing protein [Strongyloides ratti]|uniref:PMP-22/EMP/MP20/Claudin superfamily-containing protein n=1 Tax=Strongyloides ratti TaxID=34506 RepID=A0A090L244_STRRB|nr:PMP-22/EMP/MP20/Claudin superfamily-containing protein [Strongyloides ratti]CEF63742.1 PMP-22/EMP/MP20/Claudin superfamily-containing protein [Strongyloides ratti]